ncbi:hypothetical protein RRG08_010388 [Elysia crispata]|uniref:Uncharacterized protein n=1 Tax=Elysia crispata TaxID=231223 RepID=A0AAE1BCA5_9GAST|nr:hypothetical protein RRG08_010388 [Elysia crispata]
MELSRGPWSTDSRYIFPVPPPQARQKLLDSPCLPPDLVSASNSSWESHQVLNNLPAGFIVVGRTSPRGVTPSFQQSSCCPSWPHITQGSHTKFSTIFLLPRLAAHHPGESLHVFYNLPAVFIVVGRTSPRGVTPKESHQVLNNLPAVFIVVGRTSPRGVTHQVLNNLPAVFIVVGRTSPRGVTHQVLNNLPAVFIVVGRTSPRGVTHQVLNNLPAAPLGRTSPRGVTPSFEQSSCCPSWPHITPGSHTKFSTIFLLPLLAAHHPEESHQVLNNLPAAPLGRTSPRGVTHQVLNNLPAAPLGRTSPRGVTPSFEQSSCCPSWPHITQGSHTKFSTIFLLPLLAAHHPGESHQVFNNLPAAPLGRTSPRGVTPSFQQSSCCPSWPHITQGSHTKFSTIFLLPLLAAHHPEESHQVFNNLPAAPLGRTSPRGVTPSFQQSSCCPSWPHITQGSHTKFSTIFLLPLLAAHHPGESHQVFNNLPAAPLGRTSARGVTPSFEQSSCCFYCPSWCGKDIFFQPEAAEQRSFYRQKPRILLEVHDVHIF